MIEHEAHKPFIVKVGELPGMDKLTQDQKVLNYQIHICACGLSHNKPFCDGHHHLTDDEKENCVYMYDKDDKKHELVDEYK